ncbi:MAG: response regulator [Nitrospirota bacterium]
MRILIVDDDAAIRRLYKEELEEEGYEVFLAQNGEEALRIFGEVKPDIVTLDIRMPGEDGIEILRKMKEFNSKLPVIMCTAYDHKDDFKVWASDAYIVKSSNLNELKENIRKCLKPKNSR